MQNAQAHIKSLRRVVRLRVNRLNKEGQYYQFDNETRDVVEYMMAKIDLTWRDLGYTVADRGKCGAIHLEKLTA